MPDTDHTRPSGTPKGLLIVLCGPSGTGKSTLLRELFRRDPRLSFSVSHTTRPPRASEVEGTAYYFVDDTRFLAMVDANAFAEHAHVHAHRYGTSRHEIARLHAAGRDIVFDIDVQGSDNLRRAYPDAVAIFLLPPSLAVLEARLRGRGTEMEDIVRLRLANARREIAAAPRFEYLVTNADLGAAVDTLHAIIVAERARSSRTADRPERLLAGEEIV